jgi:hypothetical protein
MASSLDFGLIKQKLGLLERARPRSLAYELRLNPCLSEAEVRQFEQKYHIELPGDYRDFLLRVGNGGAGVFPLGIDSEAYSYDQAMERWLTDDRVLDQPFPHSEAWNITEPEDDDGSWFGEVYCHERYTAGSLFIHHYGCAVYDLLVITGPERGNVWRDARADRKGIFPLPGAMQGRLWFGAWFMQLLDRL